MSNQINGVAPPIQIMINALDSQLSPVEGRVMKALSDASSELEEKLTSQLNSLDARIVKAMNDMEAAEKKEEARLDSRIVEEAKLAAERLEEKRTQLKGGLDTLEERAWARFDEVNARANDLQSQINSNMDRLEEALNQQKMISEEQ